MNIKFYKTMAVPVYGFETWMMRKNNWNKIQVAEMKYSYKGGLYKK